jgi:hypothetical protein
MQLCIVRTSGCVQAVLRVHADDVREWSHGVVHCDIAHKGNTSATNNMSALTEPLDTKKQLCFSPLKAAADSSICCRIIVAPILHGEVAPPSSYGGVSAGSV